MHYFDANIFIYAALAVDEKASVSKNILVKISEGETAAATSTLTWDEIVWVIKRESDYSFAKKQGLEFLQMPNLKFLPVDTTVIIEAQRLIEAYNLKPRDAIHAASAIRHGIKEFVSDDPDFDKVSEIKRIKL